MKILCIGHDECRLYPEMGEMCGARVADVVRIARRKYFQAVENAKLDGHLSISYFDSIALFYDKIRIEFFKFLSWHSVNAIEKEVEAAEPAVAAQRKAARAFEKTERYFTATYLGICQNESKAAYTHARALMGIE